LHPYLSNEAKFVRARNSILGVALALGLGLPAVSARAETVVRYGISMADIPLTGQPERRYP
jgi:peptide/nickel transport system substrate-binding protein